MSLEAFRSEINRHLCGKKNLVSHFSSWTADLQTAIRYACGAHDRLIRRHRHIGVFDTSRRDDANVILHVRTLREEGHTTVEYDYEYLVYGPVNGISYTCLTLPGWRNTPLDNPLHPPLYTCWSGWPGFRRFNALSPIRRAYNRAARYSFYHAAATAQEARWASCTDTALYLTIIAAEWSQEVSKVIQAELIVSDTRPLVEKWWQLVVSDLSQVIEWAARDTSLVLPLVNPHTHQTDLPEVALMIKILLNFEDEIIKLRSNPQRKPWSLTRFLWGYT